MSEETTTVRGVDVKFAVLGARGTAGSEIVRHARTRGHGVSELSRSTGVDVATGVGLVEAFAGHDAVIDASGPQGADVIATHKAAARHISKAAQEAGVGHLVYLSICNIDGECFDDFDYYVAKREQEDVYATSPLPTSIVRSAQWMEFATNPAAVSFTDGEVTVSDWFVQPIAVGNVAEVLVRTAENQPTNFDIAGPEQIHLPELTERLLRARGDRRPVRAEEPWIPELATGAVLAPKGAEILGPTPSQWLEAVEAE